MPSLVPSLDSILSSNVTAGCFSYEGCKFDYISCNETQQHFDLRYSEASAAWVLITSIIVFFMKHQDAFASAIGFFFIGYLISHYRRDQDYFIVHDPMLWFYEFNFASNAATIVGGCLLKSEYKMRIPAAFFSAFVISGFIHPVIARLIWSDSCDYLFSLSPYRFCIYDEKINSASTCNYSCSNAEHMGFWKKGYVLDFAGGGAVHMLGGIAGLILALFAKLEKFSDSKWCIHCFKLRDGDTESRSLPDGAEESETSDEGFWLWMYPKSGGDETLVAEAGLGVMILWFCWFAFNCGSTESVELTKNGIPGYIAVNMVMAVASGGTVAVAIAYFVQLRYDSECLSPNQIANGVLSGLVAITAGCPFVDCWGAIIIGGVAVVLYHGGCWFEYKLGIEDGARVFPVHGLCGFWSVVAVGFFVLTPRAQCNLHATFEGLCYCGLRLPPLHWYDHILAQFLGAFLMLGISALGCIIMYGFLFCCPARCCSLLIKCAKIRSDTCTPRLKGGLLLAYYKREPAGNPSPITEAQTTDDQEEPDEYAPLLSHDHSTYGSGGSSTAIVQTPLEPPSDAQTYDSYHTAPTSTSRRRAPRDQITGTELSETAAD